MRLEYSRKPIQAPWCETCWPFKMETNVLIPFHCYPLSGEQLRCAVIHHLTTSVGREPDKLSSSVDRTGGCCCLSLFTGLLLWNACWVPSGYVTKRVCVHACASHQGDDSWWSCIGPSHSVASLPSAGAFIPLAGLYAQNNVQRGVFPSQTWLGMPCGFFFWSSRECVRERER